MTVKIANLFQSQMNLSVPSGPTIFFSLTILVSIASVIFNGGKVTAGPDGRVTLKTTAPNGSKSGKGSSSVTEAATDDSSIAVKSLPTLFRGDGTRAGALDAMRTEAEILAELEASVDCSVALLDESIMRNGVQINTLRSTDITDSRFLIDIRSLQTCLTVLGRYEGPRNSDVSTLQKPILAFQKERGLRPDGIIGGNTWRQLKAEVLKALAGSVATPSRFHANRQNTLLENSAFLRA